MLSAVAITVVAWASAFIAIRSIGTTFDPGPLTLGRLVVGSVALGLLLLARRQWVTPNRREWFLIVLCGLAWFGIYNIALNAGEQRLDAGTAAMLVGVGPILIAVLAGALLGEGFPRWLIIGTLVAFLGAIVIGAASAHSKSTDSLGVILCLIAAVAYAIGVLAQKPTLRRLPALQVTWLACTVGAVACLPFAQRLIEQTGTATPGARASLVYLGLVPTAVAFTTWAYALSHMNAGRLGVTSTGPPPHNSWIGPRATNQA